MSAFDGNGYFYNSYLVNSTISNINIIQSIIKTSTLNMLDINGNYQNIINVKDPINLQDAATKNYVDTLGISFNISLSNTTPSLISSNIKGSYIITITNNVLNGPSAIFNITKNESNRYAGLARIVSSPGLPGNTHLKIYWLPNSGIYLYKTNSLYDGSYSIKMI